MNTFYKRLTEEEKKSDTDLCVRETGGSSDWYYIRPVSSNEIFMNNFYSNCLNFPNCTSSKIQVLKNKLGITSFHAFGANETPEEELAALELTYLIECGQISSVKNTDRLDNFLNENKMVLRGVTLNESIPVENLDIQECAGEILNSIKRLKAGELKEITNETL